MTKVWYKNYAEYALQCHPNKAINEAVIFV